jgi:hypothetical protein
MKIFAASAALLLGFVPSSLVSQSLSPQEWLNGFLTSVDEERYALEKAFYPCPARDANHEAVVALFLAASFPPDRVERAALGFAEGVSQCGDERALSWLIVGLDNADSDPQLASTILRQMGNVGHRSPRYAASVSRLLRSDPPAPFVLESALMEGFRLLTPDALRDVFLEVYPARRLDQLNADRFIRRMVSLSGDAFLSDLTRLINANPSVIATPGFILSVGRAIAPDGGQQQTGPGALALLQTLEAHAGELGNYHRDAIQRLKQRVGP